VRVGRRRAHERTAEWLFFFCVLIKFSSAAEFCRFIRLVDIFGKVVDKSLDLADIFVNPPIKSKMWSIKSKNRQ
jgi:hypothetical protein